MFQQKELVFTAFSFAFAVTPAVTFSIAITVTVTVAVSFAVTLSFSFAVSVTVALSVAAILTAVIITAIIITTVIQIQLFRHFRNRVAISGRQIIAQNLTRQGVDDDLPSDGITVCNYPDAAQKRAPNRDTIIPLGA